jgi:hypothetical protein
MGVEQRTMIRMNWFDRLVTLILLGLIMGFLIPHPIGAMFAAGLFILAVALCFVP